MHAGLLASDFSALGEAALGRLLLLLCAAGVVGLCLGLASAVVLVRLSQRRRLYWLTPVLALLWSAISALAIIVVHFIRLG